MTIDELLKSEGYDETCYGCQYGAQDEPVNFRGCDCPEDKLCPRIPLEELEDD